MDCGDVSISMQCCAEIRSVEDGVLEENKNSLRNGLPYQGFGTFVSYLQRVSAIGNPFFFCHHVKHFLLHRYYYFYAQLQFPGNAFSNWAQKGDHMSLITLALLNIVTDIANICWNLRDPRGRIFSYLPLLQLSACFPWNALFSFWSAISRLWFSRGLLKVVPLMRWEWRNSELGVLNWTKRKLIISWSSRGPVMLSN